MATQNVRGQPSRSCRQAFRPAGILSLTVTITVIAVLWLFVLPWIAQEPQMKSHLDWLDERGIDPSAMFYTELDAMGEILRRQRARDGRNDLFPR